MGETMSVLTAFDLDRFARAAEQRDAATQLAMYGPSATVTIVDKVAQPRAPRVLRTRDEIKAWLEDVCSRDMTHSITQSVSDPSGAAFAEACRYPDGTNVLCMTVIALESGQIADQTVIQAWDED
jgi:hypothetical protein